MDTRLQIVERLYSEGERNHVPPPDRSEEGEGLAPEFQAMSQAKFWMDHRRRLRPDAATIDRVVDAAAAATRGQVPGVVRPDRSPLRLVTSPRFRVAVAASLVVAVAGLGIWRTTFESDTAQELVSMEEAERQAEPAAAGEKKLEAPVLADADLAAGEGFRRDSRDDSAMLVGRAAPKPAFATPTAAATEWDDAADVARLHQRIDMLRLRQADEGWDKPVVPLEMMPADNRAAGIHQAGSPGN